MLSQGENHPNLSQDMAQTLAPVCVCVCLSVYVDTNAKKKKQNKNKTKQMYNLNEL